MREEHDMEGTLTAGAVALFWRHEDDPHLDWVRISDLLEGEASSVPPAEDVVREATSVLYEYSAQKRHLLLEGDGPDKTEAEIDAMDGDELQAFSDAVMAHNARVETVHRPWVEQHGVLIVLPDMDRPELDATMADVVSRLALKRP